MTTNPVQPPVGASNVIAPEHRNPPPKQPLPEVRQCQDAANWQFGCVAVKGQVAWGVMNHKSGGHWAPLDDADIATWKVLQEAQP